MQSNSVSSSFNTPLTYQKSGSGPALILVNAYGTETKLWEGVIADLESKYTVLVWELRGMDDAHKPSDDFLFNVDQHAQDLGSIMDAEGLESAHLVAWCSGAKVVLEFQAKHPERCKSLVLISGNFSPFGPKPDCQTEWDKNMLAATDLYQVNPAARPFFYDAINTAIEALMRGETEVKGGRFGLLKMVSPKYIEMLMKPMFNEVSMGNYLQMINAYYKYDITPLLDGVEKPVCLIWSESDHISHPEQSKMVAELLANAESVVIPDSNHYMVIEKPGLIAEHIDQFAAAHN